MHALSLMKTTNYQLVVARLENARASAPYSRSSIPRPGLKSGWNLEDTPQDLRRETPGSTNDLPAASLARLARLKTLAQGARVKAFTPEPCGPAFTNEEFKKIPMSFAPPRFKTQKNGKTVEDKWLLRLILRSVSFTAAGGVQKTWTSTAKLKGEEVIPPTSAAGGQSFSALTADFTRRWGADKAAELIAFLRHA